MIIQNVKIFRENKTFVWGAVRLKEDRIEEVAANQPWKSKVGEESVDGKGRYLIPGLIDLHFHGCKGDDFCDGTLQAIQRIAEYEASQGITGIAPATMTLSVETLEKILKTAAEYKRQQKEKSCLGADLLGINMEGPFISPAKKGAQDARYCIPCSETVYRKFQTAAEGLVKLIGIAPEEGDAISFLKAVRGEVGVSLAHTNADYDTAKKAFDNGASHAVHLFNAMPPFTHREPGVVGAVADSSHVTAELICDGIHLHPSMVRAAFRMLGEDRIILISDSMRATGMPDGTYTLGGLEVKVTGNRAVLAENGALAGSVTNLMDCMKHCVLAMGIPLAVAVFCASSNPAKRLGVYDNYGSIEAGKKANLVLLEEDLTVAAIWKDGVEIRRN